MNRIKVLVSGASGRMGREVIKAVLAAEDLQLVAAVDVKYTGTDVGYLVGLEPVGVKIHEDLTATINESNPEVMVDFTNPQAVLKNIKIALENKVHPVVGTTGLTDEETKEIQQLSEEKATSVFIAPNFAIGAVLMMKFAQEAAKYFPHAEVIELHHDEKLDAPSGTAIKTLEMISEVREERRQGHINEYEKITSSRGGNYQGMRVHSVRLPGLVAHQEVIFGDLGQTLTIRHDSINRESFAPGIVLAIRNVQKLTGLVYGLEKIM
ncbi:MAG: 4-hydroxy-tetrahydrodipicolinate reductase [Bacillota bacterium]|nr:4-hydroxy-tetrahydrodipicolinate reductase [Bacillota bacterium]